MIFHLVNVEMNETDAAASARTIFNFFVFQQEAAIVHYADAKGDYEGALAANKRAEEVYNEESEGLGFGPRLPYQPYNIEQKKKEMDKAKKDLEDTRRLLAFVRERFVEKFIQ